MRKTGIYLVIAGVIISVLGGIREDKVGFVFFHFAGADFLVLLSIAFLISGLILIVIGSKI